MKTIRTEDGQDITEPVQILYDMAHASMDWGSGMLDSEEMLAVVRFAIFMGWQVPDLPDNGPIAQIAAMFPEHYDIETVTYPEARDSRTGVLYREERSFTRVRTRRPAGVALDPDAPTPDAVATTNDQETTS